MDKRKYAWVDEAACAGLPTEVFFPKRGTSDRLAVEICARCPVRQACLDSAMEEESFEWRRYGLRGGLFPLQRHALARERR